MQRPLAQDELVQQSGITLDDSCTIGHKEIARAARSKSQGRHQRSSLTNNNDHVDVLGELPADGLP